MSHLSPCIYLLWTLLTTALGGFYFYHLWKFDRLRCLRLSRGPYAGTFKRIMTYSYLTAVPLLLSFSVAFTMIKYEEGYIVLPSGQAFPKPYNLWTPGHQAAIFPLDMLYALSWGAEAVSHLEELCFWLFLIHSGPTPKPWFKSIYFKIWVGGSIAAIVLVPVVTAATKDDPLKSEAWLQFTGSTIGLLITLGFLPILWIFPRFVQNVKNEGADIEAVTRLAKFHDLNITRTVFRFLFVVPIFMLAVDGLTPHNHTLNESQLWTDLLAMMSSIGCIVQSAITLLIFFPRNVELETERWLRDPPPRPSRIALPKVFKMSSKGSSERSQPDVSRPQYLLTDSPVHSKLDLPSVPYNPPPQHLTHHEPPHGQREPWDDAYSTTSLDQQKQWHGVNSGVSGSTLGLTEANLRNHSELVPKMNPLARLFTSPLDIDSEDVPQSRRTSGRYRLSV